MLKSKNNNYKNKAKAKKNIAKLRGGADSINNKTKKRGFFSGLFKSKTKKKENVNSEHEPIFENPRELLAATEAAAAAAAEAKKTKKDRWWKRKSKKSKKSYDLEPQPIFENPREILAAAEAKKTKKNRWWEFGKRKSSKYDLEPVPETRQPTQAWLSKQNKESISVLQKKSKKELLEMLETPETPVPVPRQRYLTPEPPPRGVNLQTVGETSTNTRPTSRRVLPPLQNRKSRSNSTNSTLRPIPRPRPTPTLRKAKNKEMLIKHFWYSGWPDHGVPNSDDKINLFILFINDLLKDIKENPCNTVIHCSAGVGRTGTTYVILKICLDKNIDDLSTIKEDDITYSEIESAITRARVGRRFMVQSGDQFKFICSILKVPMPVGVNFEEIGIDSWDDQTLVNFDDQTIDNEKIFSEKCRQLNRYLNILPWNNNNVRLKLINGEPCSSYINASYIESNVYGVDNNFKSKIIASECPSTYSKDNFLRMLRQENIGRIIMVTNLYEGGKLKCNDYTFSSDDESIGKHNYNKSYGAADLYELSINNTELKYKEPIVFNTSSYEQHTLFTPTSSNNQISIINNAKRPSITIVNSRNSNSKGTKSKKSKGKQSKMNNKQNKIKKLIEFMSKYINEKTPLTFCDCKIILLYIFINNLLPENSQYISNLLLQSPVQGSFIYNNDGIILHPTAPLNRQNGYLIKETFKYIENLTNLKNLEKIIPIASCFKVGYGIDVLLIDYHENYSALFGDDIYRIEDTFNNNGDLKDEIKNKIQFNLTSNE